MLAILTAVITVQLLICFLFAQLKKSGLNGLPKFVKAGKGLYGKVLPDPLSLDWGRKVFCVLFSSCILNFFLCSAYFQKELLLREPEWALCKMTQSLLHRLPKCCKICNNFRNWLGVRDVC